MGVEVHACSAKQSDTYQRIAEPISPWCLDEVEDEGYPIHDKLGLGEEGIVYGDPVSPQQMKLVIKDLMARYPEKVQVLVSRHRIKPIEWNRVTELVHFLNECLDWAEKNNDGVRLALG